MRASLAILLLLAGASAVAADLGTLFHSAAERERLDKVRRGEAREGVAVPMPDPVITGYVKRSDGKSTVFIDKQPVPVRNPRLERRLDPRVVERYEPLPMPEPPPVEPLATPPATKATALDPKAADPRAEGKSREGASTAAKPPAARRRVEKDD